MTHVHLVLCRLLFFWPLLGIDPVPDRVGYPFRVLLAVLTLPFHAFLGITIMGRRTLIGEDWYPSLVGPMGAWLPGSTTSSWPAGSCGPPGTSSALLFFGVLFVQWVRSSSRRPARGPPAGPARGTRAARRARSGGGERDGR